MKNNSSLPGFMSANFYSSATSVAELQASRPIFRGIQRPSFGGGALSVSKPCVGACAGACAAQCVGVCIWDIGGSSCTSCVDRCMDSCAREC